MERPWIQHYDPGVPATLIYPAVPVHRFFEQAAQQYPERACTVFQDHTITYRQMEALVDRLARGLVTLGVRKGDRVAVMMPNLPQFVLSFYAILKAGGVVVALNPLYQHTELEYQLGDSGARTLIALRSFAGLIQSVRAKTALETLVWTDVEDAFRLTDALDEGGGAVVESAEPALLDLLRSSPAGAELPAVGAEDVAIYQYSGGTTGIPKGAVGLHRNLVANTLMFRHWLVGLEAGREVVLAAIPLFHVYGMVIAMSVGVYLGATLVLVPSPRNIEEVLRNIETYRATLFPGVPNLYQAINNHPNVVGGKVKLGSIKACISGSAPLLAETKADFERFTGGKLMEGYGLSEAPTATHCNPMLGENRVGSIGLPLPDVDCRIVDLETGLRDLPVGEAGELIVRSPQVMQGYHNRPDETEIALRDGWLYTGDIAYMDGDGYFYLIDRKKELIKIGGLQVWPREVEEVLMAHPAVKEAAAAGVPDPVRVEVVKAWVVAKPGASLNVDDVREWCGRHLARYKIPSLVEFRTELPRTLVGKVLRRELVRQHKEGIRV
ncbi:MAG TPA: long-chain fatty acid--CoA ligase [Anaerolineaceae bacterium]|nr:long-chain fatty acid--CoA ligase [Anaerolineaceae bacterium]